MSKSGSVGFVPTMGALHEGHLSLVKISKKQCDNTIISIFINPAQFSPDEDFSAYPKTLDQDLKHLKKGGVAAVFMPTADELYKDKENEYFFDTPLALKLEGASRPHFFKGVTMVVNKLFNLINPTHTVFGQKDAQQLLIIKHMIDDKKLSIELLPGPTVRDQNGLALSSRNVYLSTKSQKIASNIYQSLLTIKHLLDSGMNNVSKLKQTFKDSLNAFPQLKIDYISIACANSLDELKVVDRKALISTAVFFNKVRLIDNITFVPKN
jgi:pantoate--beta-alanine ligase